MADDIGEREDVSWPSQGQNEVERIGGVSGHICSRYGAGNGLGFEQSCRVAYIALNTANELLKKKKDYMYFK